MLHLLYCLFNESADPLGRNTEQVSFLNKNNKRILPLFAFPWIQCKLQGHVAHTRDTYEHALRPYKS